MCLINKMAKKNTFEWRKCVPEVIFLRFRGGIWSIKVVSDFRFGDRKCHFWSPPNRKYCTIFAIWGGQKWHFQSPKRKSETTFIDQIPPLNLGKITFVDKGTLRRRGECSVLARLLLCVGTWKPVYICKSIFSLYTLSHVLATSTALFV